MSDDDYNAGRNAGVRAAAKVADDCGERAVGGRILALLRPETGSSHERPAISIAEEAMMNSGMSYEDANRPLTEDELLAALTTPPWDKQSLTPSDSVNVPREPTDEDVVAASLAYEDELWRSGGHRHRNPCVRAALTAYMARYSAAPASPSPARGMEVRTALEDAAKAICRHIIQADHRPGAELDAAVDSEWRDWEGCARAVIEALRHRTSLPDGGKG
jgi:hypothetical protein